MKGKLLGVLVVLLVGLLAMTAVHAADSGAYNALSDVKINDHTLTDNLNELRDYNRGDTLDLTFDVVGYNLTDFGNISTIKDVRVEAFVRGTEHNDNIDAITDNFDVESNRVYSKDLQLTLPENMDRDEFTLTIQVTSRDGVIAQKEYTISVASGGEDHDLIVKDAIFSPEDSVTAGSALLSTVKVENRGTRDENDVKVNVAIPALNISSSAYLDEVKAEGSSDDVGVSEELYMRIPKNALTGDYRVVVTADYFDGDYTAEKDFMIHVDGVSPAAAAPVAAAPAAKVMVSYIEAQDLVAGDAGKMYPLTLVNPTSTAKTVVVSVSGVDAFGTATVQPSNVFILDAGATQMVPLYVSADADAAAGEHTFAVTLSGISDTNQTIVMKADVQAPAKPVQSGWDNVKKGFEIALLVLVVLLVLLGLIIGFGKLRSHDDDDDEAQTYY